MIGPAGVAWLKAREHAKRMRMAAEDAQAAAMDAFKVASEADDDQRAAYEAMMDEILAQGEAEGVLAA